MNCDHLCKKSKLISNNDQGCLIGYTQNAFTHGEIVFNLT
jgi:hypothetical protein